MQEPYRFASVTGPDGKERLKVEVYGPLPDPYAGLSDDARKKVAAMPRTWGEFILLAQTRYHPVLAQEAVRHFITRRRRLRYEQKCAHTSENARTAAQSQQNADAAYDIDIPDLEPQM